jgi:ribose ABC transporter membrane protein
MNTRTVNAPAKRSLWHGISEQKSLIALLILIAVVATQSSNFFTLANLFNILQQTSVNAIMAVGMTLVILAAGIDLSVGSLLAFTGSLSCIVNRP